MFQVLFYFTAVNDIKSKKMPLSQVNKIATSRKSWKRLNL